MYEDETFKNFGSAYRTGKELYRILAGIYRKIHTGTDNVVNNQTAQAVIDKATQPFVFTGQFTDLCYFKNSEIMPVETLNRIAEPISSAVKENFNLALKEGLISIDQECNFICITEKGKNYISTPEFEQAAAIDQNRAITNMVLNNERMSANSQTFGVELNGTDNDLNFFLHGAELDLKQVAASPNTDAAERVFVNAEKWEKTGLVKRSADNTLSLTEKGKGLLSSNSFQASTSKLPEKTLGSFLGGAGKVVVTTKRIFNAALQSDASATNVKTIGGNTL